MEIEVHFIFDLPASAPNFLMISWALWRTTCALAFSNAPIVLALLSFWGAIFSIVRQLPIFNKPEFGVLIRISKRKRKRVCTSHTEFVTNLWQLWRSQTVTNLNLWPNLFLRFLFSFFSKTGLVTFWLQISQMVTISDVTGTNLFVFTFSRKWFRMKWNPEKHNRMWPLFLFYVWNPDQNGS